MFDNPAAQHHVICVKNRGLSRSDRHLRFIEYYFGPIMFMGEESCFRLFVLEADFCFYFMRLVKLVNGNEVELGRDEAFARRFSLSLTTILFLCALILNT